MVPGSIFAFSSGVAGLTVENLEDLTVNSQFFTQIYCFFRSSSFFTLSLSLSPGPFSHLLISMIYVVIYDCASNIRIQVEINQGFVCCF